MDYAALTLAAQLGQASVVNELLADGARINRQEKDGWTALSWAARKGHASVVDALLAAGARTDLQEFTYGDTALGAAKGAGVKALLTAAAKKTPAQRIAVAAAEVARKAPPAARATAKAKAEAARKQEKAARKQAKAAREADLKRANKHKRTKADWTRRLKAVAGKLLLTGKVLLLLVLLAALGSAAAHSASSRDLGTRLLRVTQRIAAAKAHNADAALVELMKTSGTTKAELQQLTEAKLDELLKEHSHGVLASERVKKAVKLSDL